MTIRKHMICAQKRRSCAFLAAPIGGADPWYKRVAKAVLTATRAQIQVRVEDRRATLVS